MPRQIRNLGKTGWAHIILRGINRENLFYDSADYERFLSTTERFRKESDAEIAALCLMSNHVHILLKEENGCYAQIMKKIAVSYAAYYNKKYERVGHVFQDRFRSEAIRDDRQFLTVLRYIYQNPQKGGICRAEEYPYTFIQPDGTVSGYFASADELNMFLNAANQDRCLEYDSTGTISDDEALAAIAKLSGSDNPLLLQSAEKDTRNRILSELKAQGISVRQLSRLTGINRNIVQRA